MDATMPALHLRIPRMGDAGIWKSIVLACFAIIGALLLRVLSQKGDPEAFEAEGEPLDDPGAEVDRRAKAYQKKQKDAGATVDYSKAVTAVLKQDQALAHQYNNMGRARVN